jgi:anti-anti-sigma factor
VIIALHGELDISARPRLAAEVDQVLTGRPLVLAIDLRGLSFMDSSGIHVMVTAGRRCQQRGQRFFLIRGGPQIDRLLAASGLEGYFETVDDPDQLADGALAAETEH